MVALWHQITGLFLHMDTQCHHPEAFKPDLVKTLMQSPDTDNTLPAWEPWLSLMISQHNMGQSRIHLWPPEFTHPSTPGSQRKKRHEILIRFQRTANIISFALSSHVWLHAQLSCLVCTCLGNGFVVHLLTTLHYMLMVQTHIQNILRLLLGLFLNVGPWAS